MYVYDRHLASASHFESRTAECLQERRSNFRKNFPDILIGRRLIFGKKVIKLFCFVLRLSLEIRFRIPFFRKYFLKETCSNLKHFCFTKGYFFKCKIFDLYKYLYMTYL
jgi:hypothetical protein